MRGIKLAVLLLVCAVPATADTVCTAGNFSTLVGTTCSIGSLTFTFNGTSSIAGGWTASDLNFAPATNGFTLSFLGGPQSVTANNPVPFGGTVFDELGLNFNVLAPQGYYLNGDNVSTSASFGASGIFAFATSGAISSFPVGQAGNYQLCQPTQSPDCEALSFFYPATPPFSSNASFDAIVFGLWANNGTAHWDGSPSTFTFSLDNNVPEPSTLSLLASGLLGLIGVILLRKRLADTPSYAHGFQRRA